MDKLFILGTTEYSFMIHRMIEKEGQFDILGHAVSKSQFAYNLGLCSKRGVKLYEFENLKENVEFGDPVNVLNTIGYSKMNQIREKMYNECIELGYHPVNYISHQSICLSKIEGSGNIIFPGAYIGTNVSVDNNNVFYSGTVITHDIKIGSHNFFAANSTVGGMVLVGNNCFIGMGAVIRNRLVVSDSTLVGAGGYLDMDTEKEDVIVPPKSIKLRKKSSEVNLTPRRK